MRFNLWIASLWPGCWHAWRGEWRGLALAMSFTIGLNGALLSSFEILNTTAGNGPHQAVTALSWVLVLGLWSFGLVWMRRDWQVVGTKCGIHEEWATKQFHQAQEEYLRGHWIEAETLLRQLLRKYTEDGEAQLLLASVQRRTRQWNEARRTLRTLQENHPTAGKWLMEIEAELVRIDELENEEMAMPRKESAGGGEVLRAA